MQCRSGIVDLDGLSGGDLTGIPNGILAIGAAADPDLIVRLQFIPFFGPQLPGKPGRPAVQREGVGKILGLQVFQRRLTKD